MKKNIRIFTLVLALIMCMTTCASAARLNKNYYLDDLNMTVRVPDGYYIMTRTDVSDDTVLAMLGMDRGLLADYMEGGDLYMSILAPDISHEVTVSMSGIDEVSSFRSAGKWFVEQVRDSACDNYRELGMTVLSTDLYENAEADFVVIDYTDPSTGECIRQYFTIVDYMAISFRLMNYQGALTTEYKNLLKQIVDNADFSLL